MLQRTLPKSSPIITILSSSTSTSRQAQSIFKSIFGMEQRGQYNVLMENERHWRGPNNTKEEADALNSILPSIPFVGTRKKQRWNSAVSQCPSSGAVFHFLSFGTMEDESLNPLEGTNGELSVLAITSSHEKVIQDDDDDSLVKSIQSARNFLSNQILKSQPSSTI